jgi:hypothetical protein
MYCRTDDWFCGLIAGSAYELMLCILEKLRVVIESLFPAGAVWVWVIRNPALYGDCADDA